MRRALPLVVAVVSAGPAHAALTHAELERVAVRPPAGASLPPGPAFRNADTGASETLAQVAKGGPLVLVFADYACATLCGPALAITGERLGESGLEPGREWRLAVIGLAPNATPASARAFADARLPPAVRRATTVLTGDEGAVRTATSALGYGYVWDGQARDFAHPVAAFVAAPDGRIVRTLSEVALSAPQLRSALLDAKSGRAAGLLQQVALVCHGALEAAGRFDPAVLLGLRGAGLATLVGLPTLLVWWSRRGRRPSA